MIFELAQDFHDALAAIPPEHPRFWMPELLEEAIRHDVHFIDHHPTTLFQCMWNSCWWHDYPGQERKSKEFGTSLRESSELPDKLFQLMETWLDEKQKNFPGFAWIRSLVSREISEYGLITALQKHVNWVMDCRFSNRDGSLVSVGKDHAIFRWDTNGNMQMQFLGDLEKGIRSCDISPDGEMIVCCCSDGWIHVYEVKSGKWTTCEKRAFTQPGIFSGPWKCRFSPDGKQFITVGDGFALLHDAAGKFVGEFDVEGMRAFDCAYASASVVALAGNRGIQVYDAASRSSVVTLKNPPFGGAFVTCSFSPDGRYLLAGGESGYVPEKKNWGVVELYDTETWKPVELTRPGLQYTVMSCGFFPDGKGYFLGLANGELKVCKMPQGQCIRSIKAHNSRTRALTISPDGRILATGSYDNSVKVWDTKALMLEGNQDETVGTVRFCAFSPDGNNASAWCGIQTKAYHPEMSVIEYKIDGSSTSRKPDYRKLPPIPEYFKMIAGYGEHSIVHKLDAKRFYRKRPHKSSPMVWNGKHRFFGCADRFAEDPFYLLPDIELPESHLPLMGWAVSQDGTLSAAIDYNCIILYNSTVSGNPDKKISFTKECSHDSGVSQAAFSKCGKHLLFISGECMYMVFPENSAVVPLTLGSDFGIRAFCESPEGGRLLLACSDGLIRTIFLGQAKRSPEYHGHWGEVRDCAFLNEEEFVSIGEDGTIRLWNCDEREAKTIFNTNIPLTAFALHAETRRVIAGAALGKTWLLQLERGAL